MLIPELKDNVPLMPVRKIVFNSAISGKLPEELKKRIYECVSWINMDPDGFSGGRKIIIDLEEPIVLKNSKVIRAIEIKGVVYRQGKRIAPPQKAIYRTFRHPELLADGSIELSNVFSLKGAMSFCGAEREYEMLERLQRHGYVHFDYPVGLGVYADFKYKGEEYGFVITGVETPGKKRIWEKIKEIDGEEMEQIKKFQLTEAAAVLFEDYALIFQEFGWELRGFHDKGFFHGYSHLLNVSWDRKNQRVWFNDFESSRVISGFSQDKRVMYRMMDIGSAYLHFVDFVFGSNKNYFERLILTGELNKHGNPFVHFLEGYFHDQPDNLEFENLIFDVLQALASLDLEDKEKREIISLLTRVEMRNSFVVQDAQPGLKQVSLPSNRMIEQAI